MKEVLKKTIIVFGLIIAAATIIALAVTGLTWVLSFVMAEVVARFIAWLVVCFILIFITMYMEYKKK